MLLPTYTGNPSLAERFWDLVNVGMPLAEAPALLFDLYITHHFYTMSGLSEIKALWLDDDSNLVVELSDGSNPDPEKILTRDPRVPDRAPTPLSVLYQIRSMKLEREEIKRLMAAASTEDEDSPRIKRLEAARARCEAEDEAAAEARARRVAAEAVAELELEPEPTSGTDLPPQEQLEATPEPARAKLPEWLEAVVPYFDDVTKDQKLYPSLGSMRDAVKSELDKRTRTYPEDRTIERMLNKYCSNWFTKQGT